MNYQELIHTYIEGDLSAQEESELFAEMSRNGELRTEFQEQMRLHKLAHSDMAATVVPPDITSSVFETLGIPIDTVSTTAVMTSTTKTGTPFLPIVFTAILSSLIAVGIAYYFMKDNTNTQQSDGEILNVRNNQQKEDTVITEQKTPNNPMTNKVEGNSKPLIVYRYISEQKDKNDLSKKQLFNQLSENKHDSLSQNQLSEQSSESVTNAVNTPNITHTQSQALMPSVVQNNSRNNVVSAIPHPFIFTTDTENKMFSLVIRSMPLARTTPDIDIPNQTSPDINNIALGLYYDLSEDHSVGIEGGRELYTQEFTRSFGNQTVIYRQLPSLYWYGLSYRFSATDLSIGNGWFVPYIQSFVGWAQNGPLAKVSGGFRLMPENPISLFAGIEASRLYYPVQAVYFHSDKYSITAGATIRF